MMKQFFFFITFLNSILFLLTKHPLAMGMILIFQTLLICLTSSMNFSNFWFSYILFLIFVGGLLILFIYVISLASNEMFNFSMNVFMNKMFLLLLILFILFFMDNYFFNIINSSMEMEMLKNSKFMNFEMSDMMNKMYNFPSMFITLLLMIYLFLCLIAICKIINIFEGPLRPKF